MRTKLAGDMMRNIAPFGLRMQPDLKERIQAAADANGRSMNTEIIRRLEISFDMEDSEKTMPFRFSELDEKIAQLDRLLAITLGAVSSPKSEADMVLALKEIESRMRDNLTARKKVEKRKAKAND